MDKAYDRTPTHRARALRNNATEAETRLWANIRNRQLSGFRFNRQVPVGPYICDFVCRSEKLVIELDGGQHSERPSDVCRDNFLKQHGFRVLRFWNNDVFENIEGVILAIEQALPHPSRKREGSDPKSPSPRGGVGEGMST